MLILHWLIVERTWATIKVKVYENRKYKSWIIVSFISQWIISAVGIHLIFIGFAPTCILTILCIICFSVIYVVSFYLKTDE